MRTREFEKILAQLNWPPIYLISPEHFEKLDGGHLGSWAGDSNVKHRAITVNRGLNGKQHTNTLWHEIGHILWPWRPHWWIYLFGEIMAGGGGNGGMEYTKGHTKEELPPKEKLLVLTIRAAERIT